MCNENIKHHHCCDMGVDKHYHCVKYGHRLVSFNRRSTSTELALLRGKGRLLSTDMEK